MSKDKKYMMSTVEKLTKVVKNPEEILAKNCKESIGIKDRK